MVGTSLLGFIGSSAFDYVERSYNLGLARSISEWVSFLGMVIEDLSFLINAPSYAAKGMFGRGYKVLELFRLRVVCTFLPMILFATMYRIYYVLPPVDFVIVSTTSNLFILYFP